MQAYSTASRGLGKAGAAELSFGFVFGLAGIAWLSAGVTPVVCLGAGLVMPPCGLVEDGQALKGLTGQGLQMEEHNKSKKSQ